MKLIKMIGTTLLGCAALMSVGVSAQLPASCSWEITNTIFTPQQQTTYQRCKDNNSGAWFANRTLVSSAPFTSPPTCTISVIGNTINTGTCLQPNLVRTSTTCQSGVVLGQSCKYMRGAYGSWQLIVGPNGNDQAKYAMCGDASCPIDNIEKGYNDICLPGSQYQQFNNPIVEFTCR